MKKLKIIDAAILVILLVFFTVRVLTVAIFTDDNISGVLFPAYFIVGGYQFTSCMVQLPYKRGQRATGARKIYVRLLALLAVIGIATIPVFIFFLYALLIVSPLLAVFYTWLSVAETRKLTRNGITGFSQDQIATDEK